jgi:hypothetical protein
MLARIIDWDGVHLPRELRDLPPGQYLVQSVEEEELTPEEEAGLELAVDQDEAGDVVPFEEVVRGLRSPTVIERVYHQARRPIEG